MGGALALAAWAAHSLQSRRPEGLGERPGAFVARLLAALFGVLAAGHLASGRVLDWYSRTGYTETVLRGGTPAARAALLGELAETIDDRLVDYAGLMRAALDDPDPNVQQAAVRALGRVGERMVRSVALLDRGEKGAAWPRSLLSSLRTDAEARLRALAASAGPLRRDSLSALAALQADHVLDLVVAALEQAPDPPSYEAALVDLVRAAEPGPGLAALGPLAAEGPPERVAGLLWAAARLVESAEEAGLEVVFPPALVESAGGLGRWPLQAACVGVEALVRLRLASAKPALLQLVAAPAGGCEAQTVPVSGGPAVSLCVAKSLQLKAVEALAAIARGDDQIVAALTQLAAAESTPPEVAASARRVVELSAPGEAN